MGAKRLDLLQPKDRKLVERVTLLFLLGSVGQAATLLGAAAIWGGYGFGPTLMVAGFAAVLIAMGYSLPAVPRLMIGRGVSAMKLVRLESFFVVLATFAILGAWIRYGHPEGVHWAWGAACQSIVFGLEFAIGLALWRLLRANPRQGHAKA